MTPNSSFDPTLLHVCMCMHTQTRVCARTHIHIHIHPYWSEYVYHSLQSMLRTVANDPPALLYYIKVDTNAHYELPLLIFKIIYFLRLLYKITSFFPSFLFSQPLPYSCLLLPFKFHSFSFSLIVVARIYVHFFETVSVYRGLVILKLTTWTRLNLNSQNSATSASGVLRLKRYITTTGICRLI